MSNSQRIMVLHPMIDGLEDKKEFFANDNDIDIIGLSQRVGSIHCLEDVALVGAECVDKVKEFEKAGYGAVVLTCHGDPNLFSLREAVRIPVVGLMEVAMHFCAMLSRKFSILTPNLAIKRWQENNAIQYGFDRRIASIRVVPFEFPLENIVEYARQEPIAREIVAPVIAECIRAIKEDDATAITFGCGAFKRMAEDVRIGVKEGGYEVPIVNPLPLGVETARLLIKQKLSHSLSCYPGSRK